MCSCSLCGGHPNQLAMGLHASWLGWPPHSEQAGWDGRRTATRGSASSRSARRTRQSAHAWPMSSPWQRHSAGPPPPTTLAAHGRAPGPKEASTWWAAGRQSAGRSPRAASACAGCVGCGTSASLGFRTTGCLRRSGLGVSRPAWERTASPRLRGCNCGVTALLLRCYSAATAVFPAAVRRGTVNAGVNRKRDHVNSTSNG